MYTTGPKRARSNAGPLSYTERAITAHWHSGTGSFRRFGGAPIFRRNTLSLEAPIPTGQAGKTLTLQESLPDPGPGEQERVEHMALQESLGHLPEEERALILLRYFENKTQTEVGRLLGMSQVQISRLEKKVLKKLRQDLTQEIRVRQLCRTFYFFRFGENADTCS